jgi:spore germination cell wall hydrolase CwlJ-like protein
MTHYVEITIYCIILWLVTVVTAPAQTQSEIVTATIILEAGGEYSEGAMQAAEVCLQPFQFSCWNGAEVASQIIKAKRHPRWREAFAITLQPVTSYTGGADHYHADYCNPYWNKHMKVTAKIGRHIFYK